MTRSIPRSATPSRSSVRTGACRKRRWRCCSKHLDLGKPLPQPNLKLLRQHRDVVLAAAEWFVGVDGVIDETEKEFLVTVGELLTG